MQCCKLSNPTCLRKHAVTNKMPTPVCPAKANWKLSLNMAYPKGPYNRLTDAKQNHWLGRAKPVPVVLVLKGVAEV